MRPSRASLAPWWSLPPRLKASWGALEDAGAKSYCWHEICRGSSSLSRVAPAPDNAPTDVAMEGRGPELVKASESEHLLEVSDLVDPRQLAKYLIEADVGLVRAQYLWQLHREGGSLPRRQELDGVRFPLADREHDCLVRSDELRHWAEDDSPQRPQIFAISHCWESREHPDPCGYQLGLIHDYTRKHDHAFDCEMWVFYDYCSLCQYQRNQQQEQSFRRAMQQMHMLYAHNSTTTLRIETLTPEPQLQRCRSEGRQIWAFVAGQLQLVSLKDLRFEDDHPDVVPCFNPECPYLHGYAIPYRQRGWCEAEAQWSAMRGRSHSSVRIDVDMEGRTGRSYQVKAPMPPELFRQRIFSSEGLKFTWRSDLMQVVALQEEVFREKAKSCEELLQKGLPDEEFMTLAVALRCFTKLRVLHLRKCQIRERGSDALAKGLQTLSAKNAKIICSDIDGLSFLVKALSQALRSNRAVTCLDLSAHSFSQGTVQKMGDADTKELAEALKFGAIVELNLAGNDIGPEGTKAIAAALKTPSCAVLDLNLEGNCMGPEGAEALLEALEVNRSVHIGYAGNGLEAQHMEALREALERNRAMRTTHDCKALLGSQSDIGLGNGLSSTGAVLKAPLKRSTSSKVRDMVQVRPKIQAMSESLRMNSTSTHLHLKWAMDDVAAKELAASLAVNSTVTHVDLGGNKIGDDGAQALASAMLVNRTVVFIDLSGNQIGDLGAKALAKALRENSTIKQINLKNNKIGPKGRKALQVLQLEPTEPRTLV